jgi:hypothetical protein
MHQFTHSSKFQLYDIKNIAYTCPNNFSEINYARDNIACGTIAIASHIFDYIQWTSAPRAQDVRFNRRLYSYSDKGIVLFAPLLHYRQNLSTKPRRKPKKRKK